MGVYLKAVTNQIKIQSTLWEDFEYYCTYLYKNGCFPL